MFSSRTHFFIFSVVFLFSLFILFASFNLFFLPMWMVLAAAAAATARVECLMACLSTYYITDLGAYLSA